MRLVLLWHQVQTPAVMKFERRDETRHLPWGLLSVSDRRHQAPRICSKKPRRHEPKLVAIPRKNMKVFCVLRRRSRRTRRVRTTPRPKEWLGSPDRAHLELSIRGEKPERARQIRACAPKRCSGAPNRCLDLPAPAARRAGGRAGRPASLRLPGLPRSVPPTRLGPSRSVLLACRSVCPPPGRAAGGGAIASAERPGSSRDLRPPAPGVGGELASLAVLRAKRRRSRLTGGPSEAAGHIY
jgi:hypothetical protein